MKAEAGLPAASRPPPSSQSVRVHEGVQGPSAAESRMHGERYKRLLT